MQIPMAKKVEDFKESVIMGFPLRQSLCIIGGMCIMAAVIAFLSGVMKINILIGVYAGIPFTLPVIMSGFTGADGMTGIDRFRKRRVVKAYGKPLMYGTGINEKYILALQKETEKSQEDSFDKTIKKLVITGIITLLILIVSVILIICKFK